MLQQQINYLTLVETTRHNLQEEAIKWANTMLEQLKLIETKRHNLTTEQIQIGELAEKIRHNIESERQTDVANGINMYLANTKSGELALKEQVEPLKAQAAMTTANAKAYEASFADIKAAAATEQAKAASIKAEASKLDAVNRTSGVVNSQKQESRKMDIQEDYNKSYTKYLNKSNDLRAKELTERSVNDFLTYRNNKRNSNANLLRAIPSVLPE